MLKKVFVVLSMQDSPIINNNQFAVNNKEPKLLLCPSWNASPSPLLLFHGGFECPTLYLSLHLTVVGSGLVGSGVVPLVNCGEGEVSSSPTTCQSDVAQY